MPPKRQSKVVTKARYVAYLANKTALRAAGTVLLVAGVLTAVLSAIFFLRTGLELSLGFWGSGLAKSFTLLILSVGAGIVGAALHLCASAMRPVAPLTRQNARLMGPEESLVRSAHAPPETAHSSLLRGASAEQTNPEELLRIVN